MNCKYCNSKITLFSFFKHHVDCKRERKILISKKENRVLTVPDASLQNLIKENIEKLNKALSYNQSYWNVYNRGKLSTEEAIAVNNLFWLANTPWFGSCSLGWLSIHKFYEENGDIYAICADWRTGPPDTATYPIGWIPAEILAEALDLIDISIDIESFKDNPSYQQYLDIKISEYYQRKKDR